MQKDGVPVAKISKTDKMINNIVLRKLQTYANHSICIMICFDCVILRWQP